KQGIEVLVFDEVKKHTCKDYDFIAVLSGLSIQLYGMNKKSCEIINIQHGINIERKSFSPFIFFGFNSISFTTSSDPYFKSRKKILISSINNNIESLYQISYQEVTSLIKKYKLKSNLNILELLNEYVENVTSEFMWEPRQILNNITQIRKSFKEMTQDLIDNFCGKNLIKDIVDKNLQL
ncbi:24912_t:CDS:2, partial [Dentiscutata erythropus]